VLAATGAALVSFDVNDRTSLATARDEVAKRLREAPLWGLVNNAGYCA
jgi:NAD(P)-dependent dehydrogenase (short-subunit alcohol dehydrogenase family)